MRADMATLDGQLLERTRTAPIGAPVLLLVGACGSGRTERLRRLQQRLGARTCQYIDLERVTTTPERCLRAVVDQSPFAAGDGAAPARPKDARRAYDAMLAFLMTASGPGGAPATFLLDEVLEVRTFESFPGLRHALTELARAVAHSPNRFVLSTRFTTRAERWIQDARDRFEVVRLEPLAVADIRELLPRSSAAAGDELAGSLHALVGGQPGYARALANQMTAMQSTGACDPISALAASLSVDGELAARCRFSYELRLHRARGYGALKAILGVLAETEPLTLTAIAKELERTPGSTKDYLSWLQDVDLLTCDRKRYRFADPILRLWVRLNGGTAAPDEDRVSTEVRAYSMNRLHDLVAGPPAPGAPPASTAPEPTPGNPVPNEATPSDAARLVGPAPEPDPGPAPESASEPDPGPATPAAPERAHAMAIARGSGSGIIEID